MVQTKTTWVKPVDNYPCGFRLTKGFAPRISKMNYRCKSNLTCLPRNVGIDELEVIIEFGKGALGDFEMQATVPMTAAMRPDRWCGDIVPLELIEFAAIRSFWMELAVALRARMQQRMDPPPASLDMIYARVGPKFFQAITDLGILFARSPSMWMKGNPLVLVAPDVRWRVAGPKMLALKRLPGPLGDIIVNNLRKKMPWVFFD